MKALPMVFISNHYNNFKCLKITDPSFPNEEKYHYGYKAKKASKNTETILVKVPRGLGMCPLPQGHNKSDLGEGWRH